MLVYCHKCGRSTNLRGLLTHMDPELRREYLLEQFNETRRPDPVEELARVAAAAPTPRPVETNGLLTPITSLPSDHEAVRYVTGRMIPEESWSYFYHTTDWARWANSMLPEPKYREGEPEARLVMMILDPDKRMVGFQGRAYGPAKSKYMTAAVTKEPPFLFGWDRVSVDRPIRALEGPIDSCFVDNGVASAGGKITRELHKTGLPREKFVVMYDNEPRSEANVGKIKLALDEGFPVFIWPETKYKDINDLYVAMIEKGASKSEALTKIEEMIKQRTFQGAAAHLELAFWKKV